MGEHGHGELRGSCAVVYLLTLDTPNAAAAEASETRPRGGTALPANRPEPLGSAPKPMQPRTGGTSRLASSPAVPAPDGQPPPAPSPAPETAATQGPLPPLPGTPALGVPATSQEGQPDLAAADCPLSPPKPLRGQVGLGEKLCSVGRALSLPHSRGCWDTQASCTGKTKTDTAWGPPSSFTLGSDREGVGPRPGRCDLSGWGVRG